MIFNSPAITRTARKQHRCTNCGETIFPGSVYQRWASMDDSVFTNKMHPECLEHLVLSEDADGGFSYDPFSGERPTSGVEA